LARSGVPGFLISFAVLIAALLLAFTVDSYPINLSDFFAVIVGRLTGRAADVPRAVENVIWHVRRPRQRSNARRSSAAARRPADRVSPDPEGAHAGALGCQWPHLF